MEGDLTLDSEHTIQNIQIMYYSIEPINLLASVTLINLI